MDFFEYASIADQMMQMFNGTVNLPIAFVVGGLCFAIVYIFQSLGLYTIAKREGIKNWWMAFVPILNTYFIGECGRKNRFLKIDTRIIATIAAVAEGIMFVLYIMEYAAFYQLYNSGCLLISSIQDDTTLWSVTMKVSEYVPSNLNWAVWYFNYDNVFIGIFDVIYLFSLVITLSCFFQTYAARRYFLFAFTSVLFPIQGILIFAVRKNKGMSYAEYMRGVQEKMYRQYRNQQQSFDQNPYNQNPYSGGDRQSPYDRPPETADNNNSEGDPFSEFKTGSSDEPFDEFK